MIMVLRELNMYAQPDYSNIGGSGGSNNNHIARQLHQQQQQHHSSQHYAGSAKQMPTSQLHVQQHHHHQHHPPSSSSPAINASKQHVKKLYAKAIYENIAESPDELAFKRGDVLTVIEQDTDGLTGWWLCSLRDRTGICPGNRLVIISVSHDSGCFTPSPLSSPSPSSMSHMSLLYGNGNLTPTSPASQQSFVHPSDLYENTTAAQKHSKRRSWHIAPNKVVTPQKCGDVYWYDLLPSAAAASVSGASSGAASQRSSSCSHSTTISSLSSHSSHSSYSLGSHGSGSVSHHYPSHQTTYQNLPVIMAEPQQPDDTYDTPKPAVHISFDAQQRAAWGRQSSLQQQQQQQQNSAQQQQRVAEECYDIPRPVPGLLAQHNITPSSSNSSLLTTTSDSLSLSSSNRSSMANMPDYDVPRRHPVAAAASAAAASVAATTPNAAMSGANSTYDIPQQAAANGGGGGGGGVPFYMADHQSRYSMHSTASSTSGGVAVAAKTAAKELPLELSSALETLNKLQNEATSAVTRLLAFVSPHWRQRAKLEPVLMDVKLAAVRLRTALHDLAEFGDGALGNAARADDKSLATKLKPLVKALRDADKLIHEASQLLEQHGWSVEVLCRPPESQQQQQQPLSPQRLSQQSLPPPDSLDQLVACAQTLTEDVRQSASFIQGNATLLFQRTLPPPAAAPASPASVDAKSPPKQQQSKDGDWLEDNYDYISQNQADLRDGLPADLRSKFDVCQRNADAAASAAAAEDCSLNANDSAVLIYYATQTVTHMAYLTQAIDAFLQTVERNQPPKFFLAYGKFVVLSAHNLVSIGDIVHRNVSVAEVKRRVLQCSDGLSEALKTCVAKTKKAAQHFPSVASVQEMVDSVVDISHLAHDLKVAMLQVVPLRELAERREQQQQQQQQQQ